MKIKSFALFFPLFFSMFLFFNIFGLFASRTSTSFEEKCNSGCQAVKKLAKFCRQSPQSCGLRPNDRDNDRNKDNTFLLDLSIY